MKLHSEVGAVIIESTISDAKIAEYIRYHHERIDGMDIPQALLGMRFR
jgi:HD-GYP domain-containing protein (c-di-GMP phosphodiesterase class II)